MHKAPGLVQGLTLLQKSWCGAGGLNPVCEGWILLDLSLFADRNWDTDKVYTCSLSHSQNSGKIYIQELCPVSPTHSFIAHLPVVYTSRRMIWVLEMNWNLKYSKILMWTQRQCTWVSMRGNLGFHEWAPPTSNTVSWFPISVPLTPNGVNDIWHKMVSQGKDAMPLDTFQSLQRLCSGTSFYDRAKT